MQRFSGGLAQMDLQKNAAIHPSWHPLIEQALATMEPTYLQQLSDNPHWLPGPDKLFNAFSQPLENTKYILFGETPYPRAASANGYAFWDGAVDGLWSQNGLSREVNRATSLRNFIKMLLLAAQKLKTEDLSQVAIAKIDKQGLVMTIDQLFTNLLNRGFVLLNASLVLNEKNKAKDGRYWLPFMQSLLAQLATHNQPIKLILFGKIAEVIHRLPEAKNFSELVTEHPYNLSFITNPDVLDFFKPLALLRASS